MFMRKIPPVNTGSCRFLFLPDLHLHPLHPSGGGTLRRQHGSAGTIRISSVLWGEKPIGKRKKWNHLASPWALSVCSLLVLAHAVDPPWLGPWLTAACGGVSPLRPSVSIRPGGRRLCAPRPTPLAHSAPPPLLPSPPPLPSSSAGPILPAAHRRMGRCGVRAAHRHSIYQTWANSGPVAICGPLIRPAECYYYIKSQA